MDLLIDTYHITLTKNQKVSGYFRQKFDNNIEQLQ